MNDRLHARQELGRSRRPSLLFEPLRNSRLSVIVPVFNEASRILANIDLLMEEVEPYFSEFEIVVISDGSTDGTAELVHQVKDPRVRAIALPRNMGKGHAVREGFRAARGEFVLFIDGGMEIHPREIRIFLGLMMLYEADIVVGSKRHPQSQVDYPAVRRLLSAIFQMLSKKLFALDVTDTQVGLKLMRKEVLDAILPHLRIDRYGFDLELLAFARHFGYGRVLEAPVRIDYFGKNARNSVQEFFHIFRVGFEVLSDTLRLYRRVRKLDESKRGGA